MKNKMMAVLLITAMALSVTACGGDSEPEKTKVEEKREDSAKAGETAYENILNEYTQKVTEAASQLVEEYNNESGECAGDITKLAELSNDKITRLAKVSNEGITKMAELMNQNGDEYDTYEEWATKLTNVYMEQAKLITTAYTDSVTK